jgi:hypothetical protein
MQHAEGRVDRAPLLVGYDGSPGARAAVRWAAREARAGAAHLSVVVAWQPPRTARTGDKNLGPQAALDLAREGATIARSVLGDSGRVHAHAGLGPAGEVLAGHAASARLLVVGHGRGERSTPGAVLAACVVSSAVPVLTVAAGAFPAAERRIVVACESGAVGEPTVGWAIRRALQTGSTLHLLSAWRPAPSLGPSAAAAADACRDAATLHAKAMVEVGVALRGRTLLTGGLARGSIVDVETSHAREGDLLVVAGDDEHVRRGWLRPRCSVAWVPPRYDASGR